MVPMTTTNNTATETTTRSLWQAAHWALCDGRWSDARRALDSLALRSDIVDYLSDTATYGVPDHLLCVIGDRIKLVNSKVLRD